MKEKFSDKHMRCLGCGKKSLGNYNKQNVLWRDNIPIQTLFCNEDECFYKFSFTMSYDYSTRSLWFIKIKLNNHKIVWSYPYKTTEVLDNKEHTLFKINKLLPIYYDHDFMWEKFQKYLVFL